MLIEEAIKRLELMLVASVDNLNDSIATGFNADSPISPDEGETETFRSFFEKDFEAYRIAITALKTQLSQEATTKGTTCDLISRQTASDLLSDYANTVSLDENLNVNAKIAIQVGITNCIGIVNHDIPSVQPERKTGHWIAPKYYPTQFTYTCSKCGYKQSFNGKFKFCPNCGADMRGEQE